LKNILTRIFRESEDEENESGSEPEEDVSGEEGSEDEDDKDASRPYMKLIKSFTEGSDRSNTKRRKLDHSDGPQTTSNEDKLAGDDEGGPEDVDLVEEPEEDPGEMLTEGYLDDEDDQPDTSDPFETHFANPDEASVSKNVKASEKDEWATKRFASKGLRIVGSVPKTGDEDEISLPSPISGPSALKLKRRLQVSIEKKRPKFDTVEQTLAPHVSGYDDVLYCNRSAVNGESIRRLACLHAVNHVFK
jgi:U3 small nucleolar RNA-associated protein 25